MLEACFSLLSSEKMGCYCQPSTDCVVGPNKGFSKISFRVIQNASQKNSPN